MNAFHIFSSAPFFAKHGDKRLFIDKTEAYCMIISALQWRKNGGSIVMFTDKAGNELFCEMGVTDIWDGIRPLPDTDIDPTMFWAGAKLFALQNFPAPCVMLDIDFIAWQLPDFGSRIIAAHEEELDPDIYPDISAFDTENYTFANGLDFSLPALNTAFLYIPDEDFKQYYTSQAISFMKSAKPGGDYLTFMVFAEQRLLPMLAKKCGIDYTTLLCRDSVFLPQNGYTHLWGAKQAMRNDKSSAEKFCDNCRRRISLAFPAHKALMARVEEYYKNMGGAD